MDRKTCAIKTLPVIGRFDEPLDESGGFPVPVQLLLPLSMAGYRRPLLMAAIDAVKRR
jgi:hypothetical protein